MRGLDYYSRTAFEFTSDLLGAQSALWIASFVGFVAIVDPPSFGEARAELQLGGEGERLELASDVRTGRHRGDDLALPQPAIV